MRNWQTILLSIALAVFTWFLVTGREVVETWVDMPLVMTNPPEGLIIEDGLVDKIQVRLRGPKGLVGNLSSQNLTYPFDVAKLKIGEQVLEIETSRIPLPSTYEIIEVKPNRLKLTVDRRVSRKIAVEAAWSGDIDSDYTLREIGVTPDTVNIRGPETLIRKINKTRVVMEEDFPDDVPESWSEDVALELPEEVEASPAQVHVEAFFAPKMREIWVKVPLDVNPPEGYAASVPQDYVRLQIEGPVFLFRDDEFRKDISVSLLFPSGAASGRHDLEYDVILPEGCRLEKRNPELVNVTLKKK